MIVKRKKRAIGKQKNGFGKGRIVIARTTFTRGAAVLFDFGGTLNTYYFIRDRDGRESDACAIESDWRAVGSDIAAAMKRYDESTNSNEAARL